MRTTEFTTRRSVCAHDQAVRAPIGLAVADLGAGGRGELLVTCGSRNQIAVTPVEASPAARP